MLRRLFAKMTTATEIAAALEKALADLLSLERAALRQLQDEKADAQIDLDHYRALVSRLEAELERATDVEAEANRGAAYDRAAANSVPRRRSGC